MGAPAAVAAVTVLVGLPGHGLAAEGPAEAAVRVAAPGQVGDLARAHLDQGNVGVVPTAVGLIGGQQILTVGAPGERLVAVLVGVVRAFEQRLDLAALGGLDHKFRAVAQIGHPLAVGRDDRLEAGLARLGEEFLLRLDGVGEELVVLFRQNGAPDAPAAIPFSGVVELAAVFREAHAPLLLRRVGDAARGVVFSGGHEHVATDDHGDLLAVGRDGHRRSAARVIHLDHVALVLVADNGDFDLAGLLALLHRVKVAVLREGQRTVFRHRDVAHGIFLIAGQLHRLAGIGDAAAAQVDGLAPFLAQIIIGIAVGGKDRLTVLAVVTGQLRKDPVLAQPDVTRHGGGMVLAERIFVALVVLVENGAVGADTQFRHGDGSQQVGTDGRGVGTVGRNGPDLGVAREAVETDVRLQIRREGDASVGQHSLRRLVARIVGNPFGRATLGRYHEDILAAFTIGAEDKALAIRRPHRVGIVSRIAGQLLRPSPSHRHDIDVALVGESDLLPVRRNGILAQPARALLSPRHQS